MQKLREIIERFRVFKRLAGLEFEAEQAQCRDAALNEGLNSINEFIESREPCTTCGHHRYRSKTLHRSNCA